MRDEVKRQAPSIEIARSLLESYARETDKLKQDVKDAHAFAKQEKLSKAQLQEAQQLLTRVEQLHEEDRRRRQESDVIEGPDELRENFRTGIGAQEASASDAQ